MALQVWLPLNRDLRNCGFSDAVATNNGATVSSNGRFGNCYSFNGTNSTINTGYGNGISTAGELSICMWIKPTAANDSKMAFRTNGTSPGRLYVGIKNGTWNLSFGGQGWGRTTNATMVQNEWQLILVTINGGVAKLYFNGTFVESFSSTFVLPSNVIIGGSSSYYFTGLFSDVRVYDNCLTDEDIKELYQNNIYHFVPFWKHNTNMQFGDAAYFGQSINQAPYNISISGSSAYFNGSAYIEFNSLNLTGGTLSMWINVASKPSAQKMLYYDPVSKMVLGFLSDGNFLSASNGSKARYLSTGMTWGQWNHIVATWGTDRQPSGMWVNGVACGTGNTSSWTTAGTACAIGRRLGVSGYDDYLQGYVNSVRVFTKILTSAEITELYRKGKEDKWRRVPEEYAELEYIQSNGNQYIDTGVNPRVKPRVVAKLAIINNEDKDYWGNKSVNGSCYFANFYNRCLTYYRYGTTTSLNTNYTVGLDEIHVWDVSDKVLVDGVQRYQTSNTYTYNSSQATIQIFKAARNTYYSKYKLYDFELYDGDSLVRHFIPVKRNSDSVIGLYDLVTNAFYTNLGSGTFTAGPVVAI